MSEDLFCRGQKRLSRNYISGWLRTFRTPPDLDKPVRDMLQAWIDKEMYLNIIVFLTDKLGLESDYALFLIQEMIDGRY